MAEDKRVAWVLSPWETTQEVLLSYYNTYAPPGMVDAEGVAWLAREEWEFFWSPQNNNESYRTEAEARAALVQEPGYWYATVVKVTPGDVLNVLRHRYLREKLIAPPVEDIEFSFSLGA